MSTKENEVKKVVDTRSLFEKGNHFILFINFVAGCFIAFCFFGEIIWWPMIVMFIVNYIMFTFVMEASSIDSRGESTGVGFFNLFSTMYAVFFTIFCYLLHGIFWGVLLLYSLT